jgi:hypothetical protein
MMRALLLEILYSQGFAALPSPLGAGGEAGGVRWFAWALYLLKFFQ